MHQTLSHVARLRHGLLLMLAALLSACGSVQNVPVRDRESPVGAVRASWHGGARDAGRPSGPGVEVGYEYYTARDTQALGAGQSVVLEGGSFVGPDVLQHRARLQYGYVAYNHRFRFGEHFELEPFIGAARVRMRLQTTPGGGATVTTVDDRRTGAIGGVTPRWRFNSWLGVEARLSYLGASAWASGETYELALVLNPAP
ncbi:MAG TPA: hypothetical protein VGD46_18565, partial [Rhizobacter sp.]